MQLNGDTLRPTLVARRNCRYPLSVTSIDGSRSEHCGGNRNSVLSRIEAPSPTFHCMAVMLSIPYARIITDTHILYMCCTDMH